MHGTYFQEETARSLCAQTTPYQLAQFVIQKDIAAVGKLVGVEWASVILDRFRTLTELHALEVIDKPLKPIIKF